MYSKSLIWEITGHHTAFTRKTKEGGNRSKIFTTERNNPIGFHSSRFSALANDRSATIRATKDGNKVYLVRKDPAALHRPKTQWKEVEIEGGFEDSKKAVAFISKELQGVGSKIVKGVIRRYYKQKSLSQNANKE